MIIIIYWLDAGVITGIVAYLSSSGSSNRTLSIIYTGIAYAFRYVENGSHLLRLAAARSRGHPSLFMLEPTIQSSETCPIILEKGEVRVQSVNNIYRERVM